MQRIYGNVASRVRGRSAPADDRLAAAPTTLGAGLYVLATITVPVTADTLRIPILGLDPEIYARYVDLLVRYPDFTHNYQGVLLMAIWGGNVVCALSSAEHYGAVTEDQIVAVTNALTLVGVVVPLWGFVRIADGALAADMARLVLEGAGRLLVATG